MTVEKLISIICFIIAIVIHEYAHAYSALLMGDTTAKDMGRMTLNPLAHIDYVGLLSMILFRFGWAKGVPINSNNFKKWRLGNFVVSIAGIITNFIVAFISLNIINLRIFNNYYTVLFFLQLGYVNIMLGVFNLLPLPPLDGSKILLSFFPRHIQYSVYKNEKYLYIFLILLVTSGQLGKILPPLIQYIVNIMVL